MLAKLYESRNKRNRVLNTVEFAINITIHRSTGHGDRYERHTNINHTPAASRDRKLRESTIKGGRKGLKTLKSSKNTNIFENMRRNDEEEVITGPFKNLKTNRAAAKLRDWTR